MGLPVTQGRVWKFGDNINTDLMMPTFTMAGKMPETEMHEYCMMAVRPEFAKEATSGDVVVAGTNFGCGSSRPAQRNLMRLGIKCLIVESMAPVFYRNCVNLGLPVLVQPGVTELFEDGEEVNVNPNSGEVRKVAARETVHLIPLPEGLMEILEGGGLMALLKKHIEEGKVV